MALCWIVVQDEKYDKMREIDERVNLLCGLAIGDQTYTFDKSTTRIP